MPLTKPCTTKIAAMVSNASPPPTPPPKFLQNVVVMRHGDRLDNSSPQWAASAARPWDPPLDDAGKDRAFRTGKKLREELGFPIHRVFVSPFLRCLETAGEVVAAMNEAPSNGAGMVPWKVKVSVEYGLSEMMNSIAIRGTVAPKDGTFSFDILQCRALLPSGIVDTTAKSVYNELPQWQETVKDARARYVEVIMSLADKYPTENLLIITHGEGVGACVSGYLKGVKVCRIEYCAYSVSHRSMDLSGEDGSFMAGDFVGSPKTVFGVSLAKPS